MKYELNRALGQVFSKHRSNSQLLEASWSREQPSSWSLTYSDGWRVGEGLKRQVSKGKVVGRFTACLEQAGLVEGQDLPWEVRKLAGQEKESQRKGTQLLCKSPYMMSQKKYSFRAGQKLGLNYGSASWMDSFICKMGEIIFTLKDYQEVRAMFCKMPAQSLAYGRFSVTDSKDCIFIFGMYPALLCPSSLHLMGTNNGILEDCGRDHDDLCKEWSPLHQGEEQTIHKDNCVF